MKDLTKLFLWSHTLAALLIFFSIASGSLLMFWISVWCFLSMMACDLWCWFYNEQRHREAEDDYVLIYTIDEDWKEPRSYEVVAKGKLDYLIITMLMTQELLDNAGAGEMTIVKASYWKQSQNKNGDNYENI